jgi:hypothetical protein
MPIIVKDNRKDFAPAPEGLHQAVCVDVIDKGLQETQWGPKQKLEIRWQIDQLNQETGRPFLVIKSYTASLNEKAQLCKDLEAWRGKKFTKEERDGFDVEKLIGQNCQLQVVQNMVENGNVYANVQAVVPLGKGMTKIQSMDYVRIQDRPTNGHSVAPDDSDIAF